MKKLVSLLYVVMIIFSSIQAMNRKDRRMIMHVPKKNYRITFQQEVRNKLHTIPQRFSFQDVCEKYATLSSRNRRCVNHHLSQSMLFSFSMCPKDIRHKILTTMLDNDEESAKIFGRVPMLSAFIKYNDVKRYAPLKISNKIYSTGRLFRMSQKEINVLRNISQPFIVIEQIIGTKNNIVSETTLKKIKTIPKNITQDLEVRVVEDEYVDGCLLGPLSIGVISFFTCPFVSCPMAVGITCCMEGFFSALYYRRASLDAREVKL